MTGYVLAGLAAGAVNGLLGAGGGMVLIPLLTACTDLREEELFPSSITIILPVCIISLAIGSMGSSLPIAQALPYLLGGAAGGAAAGFWGRKIPVKWLHKTLGILILWGGVRYLCF